MSDKWVADITVVVPKIAWGGTFPTFDESEIRKVTLFGSTVEELLNEIKTYMIDHVLEIHVRRTES